eukprot:TRINITY_DN40807_c0_g2_i1.p1 TRINITY_DN40807_c0_g2~~TRINITY_DN40807_c0_g2_i1.p1  ORF type:complete len:474 (-),score=149.18 TRINITY_DN40807_c0_g2_i1:84-1505(-)
MTCEPSAAEASEDGLSDGSDSPRALDGETTGKDDAAGGDEKPRRRSKADGEGKAAGAGAAGTAEEANAVSKLQEHIQGCSSFTPHQKILTWACEHQLDNGNSLQFRESVSFAFGDVPHHFAGGWQSSKKKAQRDTAQRILHYLNRQWEEPDPNAAPVMPPSTTPASPGRSPKRRERPSASGGAASEDASPEGAEGEGDNEWDAAAMASRKSSMPRSVIAGDCVPEALLEELDNICADTASAVSSLLDWQLEESTTPSTTGAVRAVLVINLHSVPHQLSGAWCQTADEAKRDAAERILWYFGRGTQVYTVNTSAAAAPAAEAAAAAGPTGPAATSGAAAAASSLPAPAANRAEAPPAVVPSAALAARAGEGAKDSKGGQDSALVEDKTILMQVQNALQKLFAKDTTPGQSVLVWNYEENSRDKQVFRASVVVPVWSRTFVGDWCKGKKAAQRSACLAVRDHLEKVMVEQGLPAP